MNKKYIVLLSEEERSKLNEVIKKLKGTAQRVRRAQIMLKAQLIASFFLSQILMKRFM